MNGCAALATPFMVMQKPGGFHFEIPRFPTLIPEFSIVNPALSTERAMPLAEKTRPRPWARSWLADGVVRGRASGTASTVQVPALLLLSVEYKHNGLVPEKKPDMPCTATWDDESQTSERIGGDRRCDRRYPILLSLRWKLIRRKRVLDEGTGSTVDLSSGGIQFESNRPLPEGLNVELAISWPVLLHNHAPMLLVVQGRIVRSRDGRTAVRMSQHEFRTAGLSVNTNGINGVHSNVAQPRAVFPASFKASANFRKIQ